MTTLSYHGKVKETSFFGGGKWDIDRLVERINELVRKQKNSSLTEEETEERAKLREMYFNYIRNNFRQQLESIEFVDDANTPAMATQNRR